MFSMVDELPLQGNKRWMRGVPGLRPTQGDEKGLQSRQLLSMEAPPPLCHPEQVTCLRQVERRMNNIHGMVASTTTFKQSATLPFVIKSEAEESAVSPSLASMLTGEAEGAAVLRTIPGNVFQSIFITLGGSQSMIPPVVLSERDD
jgi:hypothetical protein